MYYDNDYDNEEYCLMAESAAAKRYRRRLWNHPYCDDPDHPGCRDCEAADHDDGLLDDDDAE